MIDLLASEPHFIDHLAPVYLALPDSIRGAFVLIRSRYAGSVDPDAILQRAARRGVMATFTLPDEERPTLVASFGDLKTARLLGRRRFATIEHGIGQSFADSTHPSYAGGRGRDDVSLFLTPNDHSARRWQNAYPNTTVAAVGCPKLESLPGREAGPPTVAISFHWGGGFPPETRSAWDEYRTHLEPLVKTHRVIGHGHPRFLANLAHSYKRLGIPVVHDFTDVCRQADLYICDTNSTIFEFASTGRPVVLMNKPGRNGYRKDVNHGLRFWDAATVGVQCDRPDQLLEAVEAALLDKPEQQAQRERALNLVYKYRTGSAARAATALQRWADHIDSRKVA